MFSTTVVVNNKTGLHARPASQLMELCQKFESDLCILYSGTEVNPKSIIDILSAGIKQGTAIQLTAEGPDEQAAVAEIAAFIESLIE